MKRPEGFDGDKAGPPPGRKGAAPRVARVPASKNGTPRSASPGQLQSQPAPDAAARKLLRRTSRDRRKFERSEVRRFTRRSRNRRLLAAAAAATVLTLAGLVFAAVYSPLLALKVIAVDGTARVSADEVTAAIDSQLGTPLALIDYGRITQELGAFALIRSYVTETVPPHTLIVHIVEREAIGTIVAGTTFQSVDPAGVVVQESPERVAGLPVIDIGGAPTTGAAFGSVVEVLLALPPALLAQVDTVTAGTHDDVTLVLSGVGQRVNWGSAESSATKAVLLAALIAATDPSRAGEFDVSAPSNGVFRPS